MNLLMSQRDSGGVMVNAAACLAGDLKEPPLSAGVPGPGPPGVVSLPPAQQALLSGTSPLREELLSGCGWLSDSLKEGNQSEASQLASPDVPALIDISGSN